MDGLTITLRTQFNTLRSRDTSSSSSMSPTITSLLIALVCLLALALVLLGSLILLRRRRRSRSFQHSESLLPQHNHTPLSNANRLTITAPRSSTLYLYDEKAAMLQSPPASPSSVPEIRITFPDEQDESGKRKSGRVVVVRVGEHSVGMEPLREEEQLPAYEREGSGAWEKIDMESIGGLKEKKQWN